MKTMLLAAALAMTAGALCAQDPGQAAESASPGIKVEKIATASAVENREPVNETAAFDGTAGRVYTWTRISASEIPAKIKHVYYAGGKRAGETELNIGSRSYRVWSYKTVWPGEWKVEVEDGNGKVLASTTFTVAASAAAEAPKAPQPPTQGK